ncbi:MAG: hypothetical protein ACYSUN_11345, partial [Planctomycetota bacterium]
MAGSNFASENEMVGVAAKIGTRMVNALYAMIVIAVMAAFGVGGFFATTNERLRSIEGHILQINAHDRIDRAR